MIWRVAAALFAIVALAASVPAVRHLRETPPPPDPPIVLALAPPPGAELGNGSDLTVDLAIAPSGRELAFAASTNGEVRLWRRPIQSDRAEPIAETSAATMPAYSPDGLAIWFFAEGKLRTVSLRDGTRHDRADAPAPAGLSFRGSDLLFAPAPGPIKRLTGTSIADATALRAGERSHAFPSWVGSGNAFVYLATLDDGRRVLRIRDGDDDREIARADSHGVVVAEHLVYVRDGALRAEPLIQESRRSRPASHTLAIDVGVSPSGQGAFAISDRLLVVASAAQRRAVPRWITIEGPAPEPIAEPGDIWQVRLSPNGATAVLAVRDPLLRTFDLFTVPSAGGHLSRFTFALAADSDPVWSPDGRRIAFRSLQGGQPQIFVRDVAQPQRSASDDLLWSSPLDETPTDWTRTDLIFHARSPATGFDIWRLPIGAKAALPIFKSTFNEVDARVSPDGRWVAYASDESGQFDAYLARLADGGARIRVSIAGGTRPQWTEDGRAILFRRAHDIMRTTVQVEGDTVGTSVPARLLSVPGMRDVAATSNGHRVLALAPADAAAPSLARVVVGWRSELTRR